MYFKHFVVAVALIAAFMLTGCAAKSDVEALQQQAKHDRQEQRELYAALEAELSNKIETTSTPVQARQADIWAEMNTMKQDLAAISGRMDDIDLKLSELTGGDGSTYSLPVVANEVEAIKFALEHQLAVDMDEVLKLVAASKPAPQGLTPEAEKAENSAILLTQKVENADGTIETVTVPANTEESQAVAEPGTPAQETATKTAKTAAADPAQLLYDKAYQEFGARQYDKARSLWAEFTTTFTNHNLVPNAIFWQGECWYQLQDYQRAILAYQDVIKKFPKSTKYKYALLKQGISFYRLNKAELGKLVLGDLVSKYPDSTEAARAKQFLKDN
ncbi:MAG: tol-pal system protein YbgF [Proteobacteria bacterium]|nr:tol-pal system protein YbgF [Pseudomonadota bacterium]